VSLPPGTRLPAETVRHERTLIAWPTATRAATVWDDDVAAAREVYAVVARTVAAHEPVTMVAAPDDAAAARAELGAAVEVFSAAIDDAWMRDAGPVVVVAPDGTRHAVHFRFNGWGDKYAPYADDATIGARLAAHLGLPVHEAPLVLEGGSISGDGTGLLVTTERCLLNPNRNRDWTREKIDAELAHWLGARRIVWLADGIAEDTETDGHVDNVVAFSAPGRALLQTCDDPLNPNHAIAKDNHARLVAAGIDVVEVPVLPYAAQRGHRELPVPVPYVNYYVANGVVVVPVTGHGADSAALALIAREYPGRQVVGVPGAVLARGGGGVHCITQPVPA
jgi:agmatine deiminase